MKTLAYIWRALWLVAVSCCAANIQACSCARNGSTNALSRILTTQSSVSEDGWHMSMPSSDPVLDRLLSDDFGAAGLPGVGVHIWRDDSGNTTVILYGFVASGNQRNKAEQKAAEMFTQVDCSICDRIMIRPELFASAPMSVPAENLVASGT